MEFTSHADQNAEHYKLLRTNPFYYAEFINDCRIEEMMENMPTGASITPPAEEMPPTLQHRPIHKEMDQLKAEVRGWRGKHAEMMLALDKLTKLYFDKKRSPPPPLNSIIYNTIKIDNNGENG